MCDFGRLLILFRRTASLPDLPGTAFRLINAIDAGDASALEIEKIVSTDPGVAATLIRLSNYQIGGVQREVTTVRNAILRMGQRAVRSLAMSLIVQDLLRGLDDQLDQEAYSRHALLTGMLARYLFARRHHKEPFESAWSGDEIFAAGLVHDLPLILLATVAPDDFARVYQYAKRCGMSYEQAFHRIHENSLHELGAAAAESWHLPSLFVETQRFMRRPWQQVHEYTALCCLNRAEFLVQAAGYQLEAWPISLKPEAEIADEVAIPEAELTQVMPMLEQQLELYLSTASAQAA